MTTDTRATPNKNRILKELETLESIRCADPAMGEQYDQQCARFVHLNHEVLVAICTDTPPTTPEGGATLKSLMAEVIPALEATGANVSLVADIRKALAASAATQGEPADKIERIARAIYNRDKNQGSEPWDELPENLKMYFRNEVTEGENLRASALWPNGKNKAPTAPQGDAVEEQDEVERVGAALFKDWDTCDRREGGAFEFYRGRIRRFIDEIRNPAPPQPTQGVEGCSYVPGVLDATAPPRVWLQNQGLPMGRMIVHGSARGWSR
ncbi:MAG TPA: hypothetical protein VEY92_08655 [Pseudoxanthomonas sp.]|nr:hypothetical protein [Pseudoxanthomonas sp.]